MRTVGVCLMKEENKTECDTYMAHTLDLLVREAHFELKGFTDENFSIKRLEEYGETPLRYALRLVIPSEKIKEETRTISVEYPGTWWQAFKERYFPAFLKAKCPIIYKTKSDTITCTSYNFYPKYPIHISKKCGSTVQIIARERE